MLIQSQSNGKGAYYIQWINITDIQFPFGSKFHTKRNTNCIHGHLSAEKCLKKFIIKGFRERIDKIW